MKLCELHGGLTCEFIMNFPLPAYFTLIIYLNPESLGV